VLYAIGRAMQRHQRLFAVLESIDNGKPIRESRDIDAAGHRHFIHHAGWRRHWTSFGP
jgi:aldehyde dehydrogenase (NAD+)